MNIRQGHAKTSSPAVRLTPFAIISSPTLALSVLQVPCLRIEKSPEDVEWMYESKDIVKFLTKELEL